MRRLPAVVIALVVAPLALAPLASGEPPPAAASRAADTSTADTVATATLFSAHGQCLSCHSSFELADVPIAYPWRSSMMANAARDPYWQGSVRAEVMDHPELQATIEDKCATCHMPMARFGAALHGGRGQVFQNLRAAAIAPGAAADGPPTAVPLVAALAADGVSCSLCHQIRPSDFGDRDSYSGNFVIDTDGPIAGRAVLGPYEVDAGRRTVMRSATGFEATAATHLKESELCATCHTLYTHYTDRQGEAAGELPEQVPYLEWLHSAYRTERSCQSCHMPEVEGPAPVTSVVGQPRERVSRHAFRGGNRYMLSLLRDHAAELGVVATTAELDEAIAQTDSNLKRNTAVIRIEEVVRADGSLVADVVVENRAGHKLPTAYPSRRVWLHVSVRDADGTLLFESGQLRPDGSIVGNDNDRDASLYEPHHRVIDSDEQVQIYEPIMVDTEDAVTTGLLFGARYVKDNRLLPRGFDPATAGPDIAVRGNAAEDDDFVGGGDRVRYRIGVGDAPGPLEIEAALMYQSIAYRWGRNLGRHDAPEIGRFLDLHDATGGSSAVLLVRERARTGEP